MTTAVRNCTAAALLALSTACAAWADQVTLKNGDRITGAIVKKEGNNLTVKSDLLGVVTVPWDQITDIHSAAPLNVVLAGQTAPVPTVTKATIAETSGQITLSSGQTAPQTMAPSGIAVIRDNAEESAYERLLKPGLLQLWTGTATLGLTGTAGNAVTSTFTTGINASRTTRHDAIALYFNTVKSSASVNRVSSDTAEATRGGWKYDRKFGSRMEVNTFNDYEYDRFQSLDLRFVLGGGLGYRAWKGSRGAMELQGGIDYNREKFSPAAPAVSFTRSSSEGYWGDDFSYKLSAATNVVQTFRMFNNISNPGEYRTNFDFAANTKFRKWLLWNLSISDRYLSDPVAGRKKNDILYTTGIGVTFGH